MRVHKIEDVQRVREEFAIQSDGVGEWLWSIMGIIVWRDGSGASIRDVQRQLFFMREVLIGIGTH